MKKVVHIIPTLTYGGAERSTVDLINKLADYGWRSEVIIFFDKMELAGELKKSVPIHIVKKRGKLSWHLFFDLEKKLREIKPDLVHTHLFGADLWGRVAARRAGLPIITTEHNVNFDGRIKNYLRFFLRNYSDYYVAITESVKKYMVEKYKVNRPIKIINNHVVCGRFADIPAPRFDFPLKILILGRLTKQKGQVIALKALSKVHFDWRLTIVGAGEDEAHLRALAAKLFSRGQVEFKNPSVRVEDFYRANDIMLMPSLWEGQGLSAVEALAAGRLLVASDCFGLKEIAKDGVAIKFKTGDSTDLAEKLNWCAANVEKVKQIARDGREYARANFDITETARQYAEVYDLTVSSLKK